jgi:hypothetical protein
MTRNYVNGAERQAAPPKRKLARLYLEDETAWLELMSQLVKERRFDKIDHKNLSEYLCDMAIRDRREVLSRLTTLLAHRLKWDFQPRKRSRSWALTLLEQQDELEQVLESQTLRNHARDVLAKAYAKAVRRAMKETGLAENRFPEECPYTLDGLLSDEWENRHD